MAMQSNSIYLERQLSSLFRLEAERAHLPAGTWLAVSSAMGEPDSLSLPRRMLEAFSVPAWKSPVRIKLAAPITTIAIAALAVVLFILLVNDEPDPNITTPANQGDLPIPTATAGPENSRTTLVASTAVVNDITLLGIVNSIELNADLRFILSEGIAIQPFPGPKLPGQDEYEKSAEHSAKLLIEISRAIELTGNGGTGDADRYSDIRLILFDVRDRNNEIESGITAFKDVFDVLEIRLVAQTLNSLLILDEELAELLANMRVEVQMLLERTVEEGAVVESISNSTGQVGGEFVEFLENDITISGGVRSIGDKTEARSFLADEMADLAIQGRMELVQAAADESAALSVEIPVKIDDLIILTSDPVGASGTSSDRYDDLVMSLIELRRLDAEIAGQSLLLAEALLSNLNFEAAQALSQILSRTDELQSQQFVIETQVLRLLESSAGIVVPELP